MELSKEVYPKSPEKKDIQSVVNDLLQDEKIVGKKKKNEKKEKKEKKEEKKEKKEKKENPEENPEEKKEENPEEKKEENPEEKKEENPEEKKEEKEEEKPIEKKRRGRPPKKNIQIEDKSESKLDVEVDVEVLPKKPRGRPRKIKLPSTPQHDPIQHHPTHHDPIQHHPTHHDPTHHDPTHILPLIQSISSTHLLHTLPDKTLKYIIFLIHLSYHTPITQNTLHTLIHTSIHSFKHFSPLRTSFIKHQLLSASSAPSEPSDTSP